MEQETGMQKACGHGVSRQWHLDQLRCGFVYGGMLQDWILARTGASSPRPLYLTECLLIGPKENAA